MEKNKIIEKEELFKEPFFNSTDLDVKKAHCFICLEEEFENADLYSCCSVCSANVHKKCWFSFRKAQKLSALRSKLLTTNKQDPLTCSVCKTGFAVINEEKDLQWVTNRNGDIENLQDELLRTIGSILTNNFNNNEISSARFRYFFFFNFSFIIVIIVTVLIMIFVLGFTANYVLLTTLFIIYEVIAVQMVFYIFSTLRQIAISYYLDQC